MPIKYLQVYPNLALIIGLLGSLVGLAIGFLAGAEPLLPVLLIGALGIVVCLFKNPEATILGLLVIRSSLDPFSDYQLPAAFALGIDGLTILYVLVKILTRQKVYTDGFWWFFVGWIALQGLWVILLPLGGLGMDGSFLATSLREWVRIFSWSMMYLLIMQLKPITPPQRVISWLFLALAIPLTVATFQLLAPSLLPPIFVGASGEFADISASGGQAGRIRGTVGLANTFATFLILFILLAWWKLKQVKNKLPWLLLIAVQVFFLTSTQSLFSLIMMVVAVIIMILPQLSLTSLIGGIFLLTTFIGLFISTEFGQARLESVSDTPLLNPNIDISRSILLSWSDNNSFNWRIAQWTFLIQAWERHPILGYGLHSAPYLTVLANHAHNEYVRALAEGGIIGFLLFLLFLGVTVGRIITLFQKFPSRSAGRDFCLSLLAMWIAMIVGMITENIWTHTTLLFYWWSLLAIANWDWDETHKVEAVV